MLLLVRWNHGELESVHRGFIMWMWKLNGEIHAKQAFIYGAVFDARVCSVLK